jgi:DNA-binding NarL/FixJ family response regulator
MEDIEFCGEADGGAEAIAKVKKCRPDLLILDLAMPSTSGLDVARALSSVRRKPAILVLSMHFSPEVVRALFDAGISGYVAKSEADRDLLAAIRQIRRGEPFITPPVAAIFLDSFRERHSLKPRIEMKTPDEKELSARQIEVLKLVADGKSNKEVAADLNISIRSVEGYRSQMMRKLKLDNLSELIRYAIREQIVRF